MTLVVDTSMTIAWLFRDERTEQSQDVLRSVAVEGALVPSIWHLEVANALRTSVRRGRCGDNYATGCLRRLRRLQITVDPDTERHAWSATRELSRTHDLTLYDAAYLEVALRARLTLASRDAALVRAGTAAGIEILSG
jgi:predicted nucleic acid-binding protein